MTAKEKAEELVDQYRMILINEDTDCGNEVLCTLIAKNNAMIAVDEIIKLDWGIKNNYAWWQKVKNEIDSL